MPIIIQPCEECGARGCDGAPCRPVTPEVLRGMKVIQDLIDVARLRQPFKRGLLCEEASIHSQETYIPCASPATRFVLSERGTIIYPMCASCATHNIRNRDCDDVGAVE
jgi:hypothetical protein